MFTEREIEELAPLVGEYGYYGAYVYPEEFSSYGHEDEQWMPADCTRDYWVSTEGRVWSAKTQKFMKPKRLDDHGHVGIALCNGKNNISYRYLHRLIADAFIPNPGNLPIVRHLNDDPKCNAVDNLAWGTQKDNMRDCEEHGRAYRMTDEDRQKSIEKCSIPVTVTNVKTGEKTRYKSLNDAVRATGAQQSNAWKVMNGLRRHAGGFIFERSNDDER